MRAVHGFVSAALAAVLWAPPLWAQRKVTIEATWLDPPALTAAMGERVTFINRSGRDAHVEFLGDSGRHHVVQVPAEVWAEFHIAGPHPYVVHFPGSGQPDLRGEVRVTGDPRERPDGRSCNGITVMGACLER